MIGLARRLKRNGVLGINRRNAQYMLVYNRRRFYPLVDDKAQTKELARSAGVAVPELYAVIEIHRQVRDLPAILESHDDFVIKPAHGSQGEGIIVISERTRTPGMFRAADGALVDLGAMKFHISNILSGIHSLGGQPDKALIEQRVMFDPVFEHVSFGGVPDIRIIVFLGVPVMAMIRLPTRASGGKANLHQGAIGAGIDLGAGRTLRAVWRNAMVDQHPDTGQPVSGLRIPHWRRLLDIAARSWAMTRLGYQGVDLVLDRHRGPLLLELNARPGLNIQIANDAGLLHRLRLVEKHHRTLATPDERVSFAVERFRTP